MSPKDWGFAVAGALLVMVLNVAASFGWMFVYSLIEPGRPAAFYESQAQSLVPLSSVIIGAPLMFLAGWVVGCSRDRPRAVKTALALAGVYSLVDLIVLTAAGSLSAIWGWAGLSWVTKAASAWLGAMTTTRRATP